MKDLETNLKSSEETLQVLERNISDLTEKTKSLVKHRFWQGFFLGVAVTAIIFNIYYNGLRNYFPRTENPNHTNYEEVVK